MWVIIAPHPRLLALTAFKIFLRKCNHNSLVREGAQFGKISPSMLLHAASLVACGSGEPQGCPRTLRVDSLQGNRALNDLMCLCFCFSHLFPPPAPLPPRLLLGYILSNIAYYFLWRQNFLARGDLVIMSLSLYGISLQSIY